jgi:hypothetical protein
MAEKHAFFGLDYTNLRPSVTILKKRTGTQSFG